MRLEDLMSFWKIRGKCMRPKRGPFWCKKLPVVLLEVLISLALAAILLSALNFFYVQAVWISQKTDEVLSEQFILRHLDTRLFSVLSRAVPLRGKNFLFQSDGLSLAFTFDNKIRLDKPFSYQVRGELFVDGARRLLLYIYPLKEEGEEDFHREVLCEEVDRVQYTFYTPPKNKKSTTETLPEDLFGREVTSWKNEYAVLPAIVQIAITRKGVERVVSVPLAHAPYHIVYGEN